MADIFVSYSSKDRDRAKDVATTLGKQCWSVWWDWNIPVGRSFDQVLEEEIAVARAVVVLWSPNSVASDWVKNEARAANKRRILLPALIEPVNLPMEFSHLQTANLTAWKADAASVEFDRLLEGLRGLLDGARASATLKGGESQNGDRRDRPTEKLQYHELLAKNRFTKAHLIGGFKPRLTRSGIVGVFTGEAESEASVEEAWLTIKNVEDKTSATSPVSANLKLSGPILGLAKLHGVNMLPSWDLSGFVDEKFNLNFSQLTLEGFLNLHCSFTDINTIQGKYVFDPLPKGVSKYVMFQQKREGKLSLTRTNSEPTLILPTESKAGRV
jgi:hypothetical protein